MSFSYIILFTCLFFSCAHQSFDARLNGYEYPYRVYQHKLETQKQNLEMSYMDVNSTGNKVAVLLHGKNFAGYYWARIIKDLVKFNYRVIVPDQVGFGKSSKPHYYQYSFPQMALNTEKLLKSLNIDKCHLVGHSMGGMLAVTMANMYPQKVSQLILINPIGLETYLDYVDYKDTSFFYKKELLKNEDKVINYQKKNYYDGRWNNEFYQLIIPTLGQLKGNEWPIVAWNNALTYGPIFSEDIVARTKKLKVPTSLIIGTRDKTGPGRGWKKTTYQLGRYDRFGEKFKSMLPKAKVIELKGLGHLPQFEDYERFSKHFYLLF